MDTSAMQERYRSLIEKDLLCFWEKAFDTNRGGIYTCFSNDGGTLLSTDKYVWSQGRMLWVLSRLCEMHNRGLIELNHEQYQRQAALTYRFLAEHALLGEEGVCAYLLTEEGEPKESLPGKGFYTSYLVDCFVIIGMMEYARVFRDAAALDKALAVYDKMHGFLARGDIRAEPYPVRNGYQAHSQSMILCNVCGTARDALRALGHPRAEELAKAARTHMETILYTLYDPELGVVREMAGPPEEADSVLARHITPGHMNECMWFCMDAAEGDAKALSRCCDIVERSMEIGWDAECGGIFRFVDRDGSVPHGRRLGDAYEELVLDTWDTKLWWVHAESLYSTLRCYLQSGQASLGRWFCRIERYVWEHFPNPDREVGEWIQILNRQGQPLEKMVALPVKDPFHILRNVMLMVELLDRENRRQEEKRMDLAYKFQKDRLTVQCYPTRKAMGLAAAEEAVAAMREALARRPQINVIFAAAPSQNEMLEALCAASLPWERVNAFHMDEYVGLPADAPQGFGNFLRQRLFDRLPFRAVHYLQGGCKDIDAECRRYSALLREYPPDFVCLGVGENGHIAFNDPPVADFHDPALVKRVELDAVCREQQVHDGCFQRLEDVPTAALTLTIPALTAASRLFCVVPASTKAEAVRRMLTEPVSERCPASILREHPQATLYLDADSSARLPDMGRGGAQ